MRSDVPPAGSAALASAVNTGALASAILIVGLASAIPIAALASARKIPALASVADAVAQSSMVRAIVRLGQAEGCSVLDLIRSTGFPGAINFALWVFRDRFTVL